LRLKQLFTGVIGVAGVCLFGSLPAKAARLHTWQFDTSQNRLTFSTESGVQPKVQFFPNPRRLVIDLPGIVPDESLGDQLIGGAVTAVRVMQADARTTRMVLYLNANYDFDPQQVKVWGLTDQQWVVQLPSGTRMVGTPPSAANKSNGLDLPDLDSHRPARATTVPTHSSPLPPLLSQNQISRAAVEGSATILNGIVATNSGFFLQTQGAIPRVQVYRTRDANQGRQLVVDVLNTAVADYLAPNSLPPQRYGVQRWQVTQFRTTPPAVRITLTLDHSSPDWQVAALGQGGIALLPVGVPASQIPSPPTTVVLPVIHPAPAAPQPPAAQPMPAMAASPQASGQRSAMPGREQIIVMLDPGHGGADPGAVGIGGLQEKLVVINVAHYAAEVLRSQGITVQMTRQGDETVDLQPRVEIAEAAGATVFVSIHANAVNMQRPEVNGLETYYFSESGHVLAEILHRRVISTMAMNNRGVKQARFFVLRRTSMPASLIEIGFVTGAADAPKLRDPAWQAQMGQAIAAGILDYLHQTR
jgi:N-acetylmuramoyl-L-alanine amidase